MGGQHRRCLMLLRSSDQSDTDVRFRYLAAKCLLACREWEEALTVLGGWDADDAENVDLQVRARRVKAHRALDSAVLSPRGDAILCSGIFSSRRGGTVMLI
jgi:Anaphase-promoting complex, cyclosome, subunit 3